MHAIEVIVASVAGLSLLLALFTYGIRLHWFNGPLLALALGVVIGPAALGWVDLADHGDEKAIIELVALFTLAIAVVIVGTELRGYLSGHWRSLTVLVFGGLALMWIVTSFLIGWILGLGLLPALMIGAVLAPIDPVLSATVSSGRVAKDNLPNETRHLLAAEATARHGLGLLLVLLPAFLIAEPNAEAWRHWRTDVILWKGMAAALIGAVAGYLVARAHRWSVARGYAETPTGPLFTIFLTLGLGLASVVELIKSDAAVAVIVAGVVFAWLRFDEKPEADVEHQRDEYQHLLKQLLQVPVFVLLGTALPWSDWVDMGWKAPALVVAILLLRRIPAVLLLKPFVDQLQTWSTALFVGWFGPVGVGALYFAAVATLIIAVTIVLHDLTTTPLSQWLGRQLAGE